MREAIVLVYTVTFKSRANSLLNPPPENSYFDSFIYDIGFFLTRRTAHHIHISHSHMIISAQDSSKIYDFIYAYNICIIIVYSVSHTVPWLNMFFFSLLLRTLYSS